MRTSRSPPIWSSLGHGGEMAAVVCGVRIGRVTGCAALGAAAETRCRGLAESADLGLPAAGIAGTLDGAHVGAKVGPAAQHGSRDAARIAVTTTPHSNLHLQPRPGVRAEIIGHRGVVFEPAGECVGAVYRRKAWDSGAGSHAAAVTATCRPTAELDQ